VCIIPVFLDHEFIPLPLVTGTVLLICGFHRMGPTNKLHEHTNFSTRQQCASSCHPTLDVVWKFPYASLLYN